MAAAMDSPFGGIGWSRSKTALGPVEADTVTSARFDRMSFAGSVYSTSLSAAIRTTSSTAPPRRANVLNPSIKPVTFPRKTARRLQAVLEYGRWKVPVMRKHRRTRLGASPWLSLYSG